MFDATRIRGDCCKLAHTGRSIEVLINTKVRERGIAFRIAKSVPTTSVSHPSITEGMSPVEADWLDKPTRHGKTLG